MFSMASLGANNDSSINNGKGPYVFKISGQIYHWIGLMCPPEGNAPRFLQIYIYDTTNEVNNRMSHFSGEHDSGLKREIVGGFQQYVVTAYCAVEQNRLDYIRQNQHDIRNEYLSGLYDAIMRGDRDDNDLGTRIVLTASFTGRPSPASKVREDTDVDKCISAELPNPAEGPDGYKIISELMMRGPCGLANKNAPCMKDGNKCNLNFPKPYSDNTYIDKDASVRYTTKRILMEERNYDRELLLIEKDSLLPKLNGYKKQIFDEVVNGVTNQEQKLIFVYGHGGTGKTFLWKSLACVLCLEERIVLAVESSGIASLLLPSGRTAHSRFKIPLNLHEECTCSIKKNSQLADLLRECDLIIWDEAPMNDRRCFKALDRCLKDILDNSHALFGGKSILLGRYFRQTLPVKKASKIELIYASITSSYLWPTFKVYILYQNMRLSRPEISETERQRIKRFSLWLLDIGDDNIGAPDETDKDLQKKVIVCPKNETTDTINVHVLSLVNHERRVYLSSDEATPHGNNGGETELLYPNEYLNTLKFAGFPPHSLELNVGAPIILLRNINLTGGLCNRTRMTVTQLLSKVIEARIITGTRVSEKTNGRNQQDNPPNSKQEENDIVST
ncbi:DNA helicase [Tanacetum coccineum]